jgi:AraC-like DNA-binding protein
MRYEERRPARELEPFVECYWRLSTQAAMRLQFLAVPDRCVDLIYNLADPVQDVAAATTLEQGGYVVGPKLRSTRVVLHGQLDLVGVRFRPGGIARVARQPVTALTNRVAAVGDLGLDPRLGRAESWHGASMVERAVTFDRLLGSLAEPGMAGTGALLGLVQAAEQGALRTTVGSLAEDAGLSVRQFERQFAALTGLTPRMHLRLRRLRATVRVRRRFPGLSWAAIAHEAGFADQAHAIHEIRGLVGCAPTRLGELLENVAFVQDGRMRFRNTSFIIEEP